MEMGIIEARPALELPDNLVPRRRLGCRAGSELWCCRDRRLGVEVVVKLLLGAHAHHRTEVETRAMARLGEHPHVLAPLAVGVCAGGAWVVTPLIEGGTLAESTPESWERLAVWGSQTAAALAHAHRLGVVHGDVTPANVLLGDRGAMLGDFGSATVDGRGALGCGSGFTPRYAAPERRRGAPASEASDVFGLAAGLLAVAAATGLDRAPRPAARALAAATGEPHRRPSAAELEACLGAGPRRTPRRAAVDRRHRAS